MLKTLQIPEEHFQVRKLWRMVCNLKKNKIKIIFFLQIILKILSGHSVGWKIILVEPFEKLVRVA